MTLPQFLLDNPVVFALLVVWSLVWKGIALWRAAQKGSKPWFIGLLVLNTFGILEILYIYVWSKVGEESGGGKSADQAIFQK